MTDREYLEWAAKAAGIAVSWHEKHGLLREAEFDFGHWNPFTDDGDALRLAVKLFEPDEIATIWNSVGSLRAGCIELDELAATRRAIVRAAAEIGRSME